jgi:nucleoside-diphosphate-sugar epimerase
MRQPILITGASGFIGLALAHRCSSDGPIRVLLRPRPAHDPALLELQQLGAEVIFGDIGDPATLAQALQGIRLVYHCVGQLQIAGLPDEVYGHTHVEGTRNLLAALAEHAPEARLVYLSTTGVLGVTGTSPLDESAPLRPETIYERTKAAGETLALQLASAYGLWISIARPALVYGPGDLHLLNWFRSIQRGLYRVVGRGDNTLHPIFIDDLVDGLLRCAEAPTSGRIYNLVGEEPVPIKQLARVIAEALGRKLPWGHIPARPAWLVGALLEAIPGLPAAKLPLTRGRVAFMTASRAYCGCRARNELSFMPRTGLREGMHKTVQWYREHNLL